MNKYKSAERYFGESLRNKDFHPKVNVSIARDERDVKFERAIKWVGLVIAVVMAAMLVYDCIRVI